MGTSDFSIIPVILLALASTIVVSVIYVPLLGNITNASAAEVPNGNETIYIQFLLFTRRYPTFNLKIGDEKGFLNSPFNKSSPTKIIIHGYSSSLKEPVFVLQKNAYFSVGDYNIIGLDWSVLCDFAYLSALKGVKTAGEHLARFINWLDTKNVPLDNIHLIGHSLGAHVAGIAGDRLKDKKVGRITGLDPAAPGYTDLPENLRLDAEDAKLVDVIHTNVNILSFLQPLGHVDFYPNGGRLQPGCPDIYDIWQIAESLYCNHARAYIYMEEAIRKKGAFKSKRCANISSAISGQCFEDTNVSMGQAETYNLQGVYYLRTRAKKPYSLS